MLILGVNPHDNILDTIKDPGKCFNFRGDSENIRKNLAY